MKATDLRIGNIINYLCEDNLDERKEWYEPAVIDWHDLKYLSEREERNKVLIPDKKVKPNYEPIELTSDIISKTHFYYDSDSESFQISDCTLKLYDYDDDGFMCVIFGNESHFINHLHQLQNLYFALTGKELEINL